MQLSKSCVGESPPWVQIPPSPPYVTICCILGKIVTFDYLWGYCCPHKRIISVGGIVAKVFFSSNKAEIKLSSVESYRLGRASIQFELSRITKVEVIKLPSKASLGVRLTKGLLGTGITGEYRAGSKKVLVVGRAGAPGVKISLNNPAFDDIYLASNDAAGLIAKLAK